MSGDFTFTPQPQGRDIYQFVKGHYNNDGSTTWYGRTKPLEGELFGAKSPIKIIGFRPRAYFPENSPLLNIEGVDVVDTNYGFKAVFGESVKQVLFQDPDMVETYREECAKRGIDYWQAKIRFIRVMLIELGIKSGFSVPAGKHVVHYKDIHPANEPTGRPFSVKPLESFLDIEFYSTTRFGDLRNKNTHLTCVGMWDNNLKRFVQFLLRPPGFSHLERLIWKAPNWVIRCCDTEEELIKGIKSYYDKTDADTSTEWSLFGNVDHDGLQTRAKMYGIFLNFKRTCITNLLKEYEKVYKLPSNKLKEVVFSEKIVDWIEPEVNYAKLWLENPIGLAERNKRHVEWIVKINYLKAGGSLENLKKIEAADDPDYTKIGGDLNGRYWNLKNIAGLEEVKPATAHGTHVHTLMLRKYKGHYVLRDQAKDDKKEDLSGGLVGDPPCGILEWQSVYDMSRYYQSLLIALNVTPEKVEPGQLGLAPQVAKDLSDERDIVEAELKEIKKKYGIESKEYKDLKDYRDSVKFIGEATIGCFGSPAFPVYYPPAYRKVIANAQKGILFLGDVCREYNRTVDYFDTDGIFTRQKNPNLTDIDKYIQQEAEFADVLNKKLEDFSRDIGAGKLSIKCDRIFKRVLFKGVKKRYAGHVVWEGGKVDYLHIKGFEQVRRDASQVGKTVQREAFEQLLRGSPATLVNYIQTVIKDMRAMKYSYRDIAIPKTLSQENYDTKMDYVRAAAWSRANLGLDIRAGDTIRMLFVNKVPHKPNTDVLGFYDETDIPAGTEINWNKTIERTLQGPLEDLLAIAGIPWAKVDQYRFASMRNAF